MASRAADPNFYAVLGVSRSAKETEARARARARSRQKKQ
jgi:hypothetical protein